MRNKELWLEFGYKNDDGWEDVSWYNEGRAREFPYWFKHIMKRLFTRKPSSKMYYKLRYGKTVIGFVI